MVYFFVKDTAYVQCEIHPSASLHRLTLVKADGTSTAVDCLDDEELAARWNEVQRRLLQAGWSGPFGRDGRH